MKIFGVFYAKRKLRKFSFPSFTPKRCYSISKYGYTAFVGRDKSVKSLEVAMDDNKQIMLVAQKTADLDDPQDKDIYRYGTLATVLQLLKLPDGTIKVLVEGSDRAEIQGEIWVTHILKRR